MRWVYPFVKTVCSLHHHTARNNHRELLEFDSMHKKVQGTYIYLDSYQNLNITTLNIPAISKIARRHDSSKRNKVD